MYLKAETRFQFDSVSIPGTAGGFWQWAMSNMHYPLLRGVLMEYLLSSHIRSHAHIIAKPAINNLTKYSAEAKGYKESLNRSNEYQHHGDFTDLQLHWGLHFELKSTVKGATSHIAKTRFYNPVDKSNSKRTEFVCPFYIFCELSQQPEIIDNTLTFEGLTCYVIRGEDIETLPYSGISGVSYKTIFDSGLTRKCSIAELPKALEGLVSERVDAVRKKLKADWVMPSQVSEKLMPLALAKNGTVSAGYWNPDSARLLSNMTDIWADGITPTWRDWEAAGFHYAERAERPVNKQMKNQKPA